MRLVWFHRLVTLFLTFNADICAGAVPPCTRDKVTLLGSPCRYKCHCLNNKCDTNAECTESTGCEQGWFGPACQYVDLLSINATTPTPGWVYDFPDKLCNTDQGPVTISLKGRAYFTWLRLKLRANATVSTQAFQLQLKTANGSTVDCSNMYTFVVSDTILDIHCQQGVFFQKLDITGEGVSSLCQVYISGGRNVALGQETHQTSDYSSLFSWHAVDGNTDSDFYDYSCTHTHNSSKPEWTLTFGRPYHVNRYVLYNRNTNQERLRGFNLEADQQNGHVAFIYTDPSTSQYIYRVQSDTPHIPVSSVTIFATYKQNNRDIILTLCEVEMFGDAVCPTGKYGRECNNSCNCAKKGENCFVSTGGCPSGCAAGYQGEGCQMLCPQKKYSQDCRETCSTNCSSQFCDRVNGKCLSCVQGKAGDYCDHICPQKTFGQDCSETCSTHCFSQLCDTVNGKCMSCVPGTTGDYCDQACDPTFWGVNCRKPCSLYCKDQKCHAINGTCISCLAGTSGETCSEECPQKTFGEDCKDICSTNCSSQLCGTLTGKCGSCIQGRTGDYCDQELPLQAGTATSDTSPIAVILGPIIAVIFLVIMAVIGVFIWRRRHKRAADGHSIPDTFQGDAETKSRSTNVESISGIIKSNTEVINKDKPAADNAYEMPMVSPAPMQTSGHMKSEYEVTSAYGSKTNSYVEIGAGVANPYDDIGDIMSNPYDSATDQTEAHIYNAINDDMKNM